VPLKGEGDTPEEERYSRRRSRKMKKLRNLMSYGFRSLIIPQHPALILSSDWGVYDDSAYYYATPTQGEKFVVPFDSITIYVSAKKVLFQKSLLSPEHGRTSLRICKRWNYDYQ
jgi:hypothetical protein